MRFLSSATTTRTADSQLQQPFSSHSRVKILCAVWRCFFRRKLVFFQTFVYEFQMFIGQNIVFASAALLAFPRHRRFFPILFDGIPRYLQQPRRLPLPVSVYLPAPPDYFVNLHCYCHSSFLPCTISFYYTRDSFQVAQFYFSKYTFQRYLTRKMSYFKGGVRELYINRTWIEKNRLSRISRRACFLILFNIQNRCYCKKCCYRFWFQLFHCIFQPPL